MCSDILGVGSMKLHSLSSSPSQGSSTISSGSVYAAIVTEPHRKSHYGVYSSTVISHYFLIPGKPLVVSHTCFMHPVPNHSL